MGINRCDISFPWKTKWPVFVSLLARVFVIIINVTSQKQHAIQCNFVIATNIMEKWLLENWQIHITATLRIAKDDGLLRKIVWSFLLSVILKLELNEGVGSNYKQFLWHLKENLWRLNASMIHRKIELVVHQKLISRNRI